MSVSNVKIWLEKDFVKMPKQPNWRRLLMLKLLLLAILSLLGVFYAAFWLEAPLLNHHFYCRPHCMGKSHIKLQQNGDYWVYNDYIKGESVSAYNTTITLTTHGTYKDFNNLQILMLAWKAPISVTLFVNGDDFEETLRALYYLKFCWLETFYRRFSFHLVIHNAHFPAYFRTLSESPTSIACDKRLSYFEPQNQNDTYWYQHVLTYPINLLRNVARLNADTYFVLNIDTLLLPSKHFVPSLMKFLKTYTSRKPHKSVFCVPIFPQMNEQTLPMQKPALLNELLPYLVGRPDVTLPMFKEVNQLHMWLYKPIEDDVVSAYAISSESSAHCNAYVSVNTFEPLYFQGIEESLYDNNSTRLELLKRLNYDFVLLDGVFLIKRLNDTWRYIADFLPLDLQVKEEAISNMALWNSLTMWAAPSF